MESTRDEPIYLRSFSIGLASTPRPARILSRLFITAIIEAYSFVVSI